jgi:hypothetical protein
MLLQELIVELPVLLRVPLHTRQLPLHLLELDLSS